MRFLQSHKKIIPRDPCVTDCCPVRFVWVKIEGCPQILKVSFASILLWKKSKLVLFRTRNWVSILSFCAMPKFRHIKALSSSWPASTAASDAQALLGARSKSVWLQLMWPLRPHGFYKEKMCRSKWSKVCYRAGEEEGRRRRRERGNFVRNPIILSLALEGPGASLNKSINFPSFAGFWWVHLLTSLLPRYSRVLYLLSSFTSSPG